MDLVDVDVVVDVVVVDAVVLAVWLAVCWEQKNSKQLLLLLRLFYFCFILLFPTSSQPLAVVDVVMVAMVVVQLCLQFFSCLVWCL